jgi:hypothetical protein
MYDRMTMVLRYNLPLAITLQMNITINICLKQVAYSYEYYIQINYILIILPIDGRKISKRPTLPNSGMRYVCTRWQVFANLIRMGRRSYLISCHCLAEIQLVPSAWAYRHRPRITCTDAAKSISLLTHGLEAPTDTPTAYQQFPTLLNRKVLYCVHNSWPYPKTNQSSQCPFVLFL